MWICFYHKLKPRNIWCLFIYYASHSNRVPFDFVIQTSLASENCVMFKTLDDEMNEPNSQIRRLAFES